MTVRLIQWLSMMLSSCTVCCRFVHSQTIMEGGHFNIKSKTVLIIFQILRSPCVIFFPYISHTLSPSFAPYFTILSFKSIFSSTKMFKHFSWIFKQLLRGLGVRCIFQHQFSQRNMLQTKYKHRQISQSWKTQISSEEKLLQ